MAIIRHHIVTVVPVPIRTEADVHNCQYFLGSSTTVLYCDKY
ncbi:MAG: hypothetical protein QNJ63_07865 [Calothrix sp. MO_192.B10]|nr:hypothetical protein [Calothrix sp. MO_192.B10]